MRQSGRTGAPLTVSPRTVPQPSALARLPIHSMPSNMRRTSSALLKPMLLTFPLSEFALGIDCSMTLGAVVGTLSAVSVVFALLAWRVGRTESLLSWKRETSPPAVVAFLGLPILRSSPTLSTQ